MELLKDRIRSTIQQKETQASPLFSARKETRNEVVKQVDAYKAEIFAEMQRLLKETIGTQGFNQIKGDSYILTESDKKDIAKLVKVPAKVIETIIEKQPIVKNEIKEVAIAEDGDKIIGRINKSNKKIKPSQIEGLTSAIKAVKQPKGGPGGGMGGWIHEQFATSSATTSNTLSNNVAANSTAILVRYNGQVLAHNVQYTIVGKIISYTFTLDDSSNIDVTYVRK